MRCATKGIPPPQLLIDGRMFDRASGRHDNDISPLNGDVRTTTAAGTKENTERAIAAARRAFDDKFWPGMPPAALKETIMPR